MREREVVLQQPEVRLRPCGNCRATLTPNPVCASCWIWKRHVADAKVAGRQRAKGR